jgi:hypothetical protein
MFTLIAAAFLCFSTVLAMPPPNGFSPVWSDGRGGFFFVFPFFFVLSFLRPSRDLGSSLTFKVSLTSFRRV